MFDVTVLPSFQYKSLDNKANTGNVLGHFVVGQLLPATALAIYMRGGEDTGGRKRNTFQFLSMFSISSSKGGGGNFC